jgi:hypothetical protein
MWRRFWQNCHTFVQLRRQREVVARGFRFWAAGAAVVAGAADLLAAPAADGDTGVHHEAAQSQRTDFNKCGTAGVAGMHGNVAILLLPPPLRLPQQYPCRPLQQQPLLLLLHQRRQRLQQNNSVLPAFAQELIWKIDFSPV